MLNKEDCQSYLFCLSRMTKPDCDICKTYRKLGDHTVKPITPPAMPGDTLWKIVKDCCRNDGKVEYFKPIPEFNTHCKHYEEASWWDSPAVCKAVREDGEDGDYPDLNLDIWCEECKNRFCISRERFSWGMMTRVVGTEMYDESTRPEDRLYLTKEQAEEEVKRIIND